VCDQASDSSSESPKGQGADDPKRFPLLRAIEVAGVPVGLGAGAYTGSWWWLLGAIAAGPVHDFLAAVLGALGRRWSRRIDPN
jgi:predicted TIM-barrel fold metal-dependent hydrolase